MLFTTSNQSACPETPVHFQILANLMGAFYYRFLQGHPLHCPLPRHLSASHTILSPESLLSEGMQDFTLALHPLNLPEPVNFSERRGVDSKNIEFHPKDTLIEFILCWYTVGRCFTTIY